MNISSLFSRGFNHALFHQATKAGQIRFFFSISSSNPTGSGPLRKNTSQEGSSPFEVNSARQLKIAESRLEKSSNYKINVYKGDQNGQDLNSNKLLSKDLDGATELKLEDSKQKRGISYPNERRNANPKNVPEGLNEKQMQRMLPALNNVRNYYKVLDKFSNQNFLDIVDNAELISNPESALILNNVWTYARKFRVFSTYRTPAFETMARTIANNLSLLEVPENVAGFAMNLHKVNHQDIEPYQRIESYVSEHLESFPLTSLAQIAYSFSHVSRSQVQHDFSQFYGKMQIVIALKLRDAVIREDVDIKGLSKDFSQILSGYSKSQNLSKEFLYVLEQFILNHIRSFQPREKMITLHSFAVNNYLSKPLIDSCIEDFMKAPESFNPQEMCHFAVSLHQFELLTPEMSAIVMHQFMLKKSQVNLLDLADVCHVIFAREEPNEEFFEVVRGVFRTLRSNVELNVLCKLLTNASGLLNKELMPHRFFKTLMESLQILSFQKELHGRLIYELKEDGKKILHPQFKQLYLDTLNNMKQVDYKKKRTELNEKKQSTENKEELRRERHFKIQSALKKRRSQDSHNKDQKNPQGENPANRFDD